VWAYGGASKPHASREIKDVKSGQCLWQEGTRKVQLPLFANAEGSASRRKVQRRAVINYDTSARYKPRAERPYIKI